MRITRIRLQNYIGIYNGMGLNDITINMEKAKHTITVITGINGCGKSTLLKAMNILPDNNDAYIPGKVGRKSIDIKDGNNYYAIDIISNPPSGSGSRLTKALIRKNGIDLNPNGNVTSYKDIIFQEFDLDSNFITLCRLSSDDRGLADKSPAERKKFMSFILDSLETYNAIYKNLNKRSNVFKSHINTLSTKIQNAGDEGYMVSQLNGLEATKKNIESQITVLTQAMGSQKAILEKFDPDGTLQDKYASAESAYTHAQVKLNDTISVLESAIKNYPNIAEISTSTPLELVRKYDRLSENYKNKLEELRKKHSELFSQKQSLLTRIDEAEYKLRELGKDVNPELKVTIEKLQKTVQQEREAIGLKDVDSISIDEIKYTIRALEKFIDKLETLGNDIDDTTYGLIWFSDTDNNIKYYEAKISELKATIEDLTKAIKDANGELEVISILDKRPKKCKIDDCYFVKKACELSQYITENELKIKLDKLSVDLASANSSLDTNINEYRSALEARRRYKVFESIKDDIDTNKFILCKTPIGSLFVSSYEDIVKNHRSFNDFKDENAGIPALNGLANLLSIYKSDSIKLKQLQDDYIKQSSAESTYNETMAQLARDKVELKKVSEDCDATDKEISRIKSLVDNITVNLNHLYDIRGKEMTKEEAEELCTVKLHELNEIEYQSKDCIKAFEEIGRINAQIEVLYDQIKPIDNQITDINSQLVLLHSYQSDYNMYSDKYDMVNTLKKYSSPTTGIQTLFMSTYMNKTLELANRVLSMIFGGAYRLLPYVINANEFRIPFVGYGMEVDDISHGSTSQVCMMGMVMNLVLKYQASPKYNITSLDEIDGGLDTRNRLEFIQVLEQLISILNIDQLFIISHSLELEFNSVDVIKLKSYEDFGETTTEGNVLYDFNSEKH